MKKLVVLFLMSNSFLFCSVKETEQEFVARTEKLPRSRHYVHQLSNFFIEPQGAVDAFYVTCPCDRTKAILRPAQHDIQQYTAQLVVITPENDIYARQFLGCRKIMAIALAANRELFAAIYQKHHPDYPAETTDILKVKELGTKKTVNKVVLPNTFEAASAYYSSPVIAFNKQGTHVIVWGVDSTQRGSYKGNAYGTPALDHMIFSLENSK